MLTRTCVTLTRLLSVSSFTAQVNQAVGKCFQILSSALIENTIVWLRFNEGRIHHIFDNIRILNGAYAYIYVRRFIT